MPEGSRPSNEKSAAERRTPLVNDVDPDGMDSESEGDELESGSLNDSEEAETDAADGPDGATDRRSTGQQRTSGTHGATREVDEKRDSHR